MTDFEISPLSFNAHALDAWAMEDPRRANWPVVYLLDDVGSRRSGSVYVGETRSASARLRQHLASTERGRLTGARVVIDPTFNKSVCLDLESFLIPLFAGDGSLTVLNRNDGIVDADYYERDKYQRRFDEIFEALRSENLFRQSIPQIENSDLFKLSPFEALSQEQAAVVEDLVEGILADLGSGNQGPRLVQGDPGTGKTVVAIYLIKLLRDIATARDSETTEESVFADFFQEGSRELLAGLSIGFVIPQQSLRHSVRRVFKRTPGLSESMVLSPFDVGESTVLWDLLVVDEAHRLSQRAAQASGFQNKQFRDITTRLFGADDVTKTQLDWIRSQSRLQVLLLDPGQAVRPADLPRRLTVEMTEEAKKRNGFYRLVSQMRVKAGADYVGFVRRLLGGRFEGDVPDFGDYDLRLFDDPLRLRDAIVEREGEYGLSRMVAGYAWEWRSRHDPAEFDVQVGGLAMRWNVAVTDWIASPSSVNEVGSIHTVQGYDLNYAGVLIGPDLRYDASSGRLRVDRASYFDRRGKRNNPTLGQSYSDLDLLGFITNIYAVLLTRGIRGTYIHAVDPELQAYLRGVLGRTPG